MPGLIWTGRCVCGAVFKVEDFDLVESRPEQYEALVEAGQFVTDCHRCGARSSVAMRRNRDDGLAPEPASMRAILPCRPSDPLLYDPVRAGIWEGFLRSMVLQGQKFEPIDPEDLVEIEDADCEGCGIPLVVTRKRFEEMGRLEEADSNYALTCTVCVLLMVGANEVIKGTL
jgi:hypothetical protein